jgi:parvulin-like peptidyl-prolyl isomerase
MQGRYAAVPVPLPKDRRIVAASVLAALLVVLLVVVAVAQGIGDPSVPSGDVAVVEDAPDGNISTEEFDVALEQAAASQGAKEVPPESDPQYEALRDAAMSSLLAARWVRGEAEDLGISVSESEITNRIDEIKKQYGGEKGFQRVLRQGRFTPAQAREQIESQLLGTRIQEEVVPQDEPPAVSDAEIEDFYEANLAQFEQPETRDVREIVNKDQAQVERAKALLESDDSAANWKKVAARFSTDKATKESGGLREGVAEGQSEPALEEQISVAAEGELIGPFKGQSNYYLIQVQTINPAETTPIADVTEQIGQQLVQGKQQLIAQDFQQDLLEKWQSRSFCADGYVMDRCENFPPSSEDACVGDDPGEDSEGDLECPVVVTPRNVVSPGQAQVFPGQALPVLPQGPIQPAAAEQPGVIGPGGAPLPPGGGAPTPTP